MGFTTLGLSDRILQGVHAAGYTTPTPIQSLAVRPALAGKDVIGCAQTGTGKTAAFVLPLLHRLAEGAGADHRSPHPRALVLTPTRELAQQVHDSVTEYGRFVPLRALSIYGGVNMEGQIKLLRRGVDIVIATPGRLLDHMNRRTIDLSGIQVFILDEADRMLDMGFIHDVRKIIDAVPVKRQSMLFSATMSREITDLASRFLSEPLVVDAGQRRTTVEGLTQHFYSSPQAGKMQLLLHAISAEKMESVLVFSRTKHGADKIARFLERNGVSTATIHSNRTQPQRQRALDGFKQGRFRVLVATDIAARGIDVDGISHVVNFDVPRDAEDYIHRVGRTSRAGASGDAVTFVSGEERAFLKKIETFTGKRIAVLLYPDYTPSPSVMMETPRPAPYQERRPGSRSSREPASHQTGRQADKPAPHQSKWQAEKSASYKSKWQAEKSASHQSKWQAEKPATHKTERPAERHASASPVRKSSQRDETAATPSRTGSSSPFGGGRHEFAGGPKRKIHRRHLG